MWMPCVIFHLGAPLRSQSGELGGTTVTIKRSAVAAVAGFAALIAVAVPANGTSLATSVPTVKLSQPTFTQYTPEFDEGGFNYWLAFFTLHWTVTAPAGVCSQTFTYSGYDALGGDEDPILHGPSETFTLSKTARSYSTGMDAGTMGKGGYSAVVRVKDCNGKSLASNPVHTVIAPGEDVDPGVTYTGAWSVSTCTCWTDGTTHWTTAKNASVSFRTAQPLDASGVSLALIMAKASNRGSAAIFIDGVKKATVDTYSKTTANRQIVYQVVLPGTATHVVKIVNLATAGHPRIDFDATINGG
jgi:hypothetical protein